MNPKEVKRGHPIRQHFDEIAGNRQAGGIKRNEATHPGHDVEFGTGCPRRRTPLHANGQVVEKKQGAAVVGAINMAVGSNTYPETLIGRAGNANVGRINPEPATIDVATPELPLVYSQG